MVRMLPVFVISYRIIATAIPTSRFVTLESDNRPILPNELAWPTWIREIKSFLAERV